MKMLSTQKIRFQISQILFGFFEILFRSSAIIFAIIISVGWIKNIIKLSECDFSPPYKAEVIHTVGLVPIVGMVTGWIDVGK